MTIRRCRVMAVLLTCVVACFAGFKLLAATCMRVESQVALAMVGHARWVVRYSSGARVDSRHGTVRLPFTTYSSGFRVDSWHGTVRLPFTTYSSSLIAVVAVGCCGLLILRAPRLRRYSAVAASVTAVMVYSSLRLVGCFWIVRLVGSSADWLFADWFCVLLVLVDTAFGYHLLIFLLLPEKRVP